jgi:hypothetical protein
VHVGQVEDDPAVGGAVAGQAVAALRTASSSPVSAASDTTWDTSLVPVGRTMTAGRRSIPP